MEHISSLHGATFLVLSTKIPIFKAKWFRKKDDTPTLEMSVRITPFNK